MVNQVTLKGRGDTLAVEHGAKINVEPGGAITFDGKDKAPALGILSNPGPQLSTATTVTASLDDLDYIIITNSAPISVLLPSHASVPIQVGSVRTYKQGGAGAMTFSGSGFTPTTKASATLVSSGTGAIVMCIKESETAWHVFGDLVAV